MHEAKLTGLIYLECFQDGEAYIAPDLAGQLRTCRPSRVQIRFHMICCRNAVAIAGLDWTVVEADALPVRLVSLSISIGGMLFTALLLSLVSGRCPAPLTRVHASSF